MRHQNLKERREDSAVEATKKVENVQRERKKRLNGDPSPNSADWSSMDSLTTSSISSDSQSPSRSKKSLTSSWLVALKKKLWRSNPSKNKLKPVKEPASKPMLLLVMRRTTSDLDGNATKKSKEPSRAPSLWPSLTSSLSERDIGETKSVLPTPFHAKLPERVDQLKLDWSLLLEELVWFLLPSPRSCSTSLVFTISTPKLRDQPELEVTS